MEFYLARFARALSSIGVIFLAGCQGVATEKQATEVSGVSSKAVVGAASCQEKFTFQDEKAKTQSLREFDQDPKGGWRALYNENCFAEAAKLILAYKTRTNTTDSQLSFHAGQMFAISGDYASAIKELKLALVPAAANSGNFLWYDYVLGTIAFLERDRPRLIRHRDALAAKKESNAPNLRVLNLLIERFDQSYDDATK